MLPPEDLISACNDGQQAEVQQQENADQRKQQAYRGRLDLFQRLRDVGVQLKHGDDRTILRQSNRDIGGNNVDVFNLPFSHTHAAAMRQIVGLLAIARRLEARVVLLVLADFLENRGIDSLARKVIDLDLHHQTAGGQLANESIEIFSCLVFAAFIGCDILAEQEFAKIGPHRVGIGSGQHLISFAGKARVFFHFAVEVGIAKGKRKREHQNTACNRKITLQAETAIVRFDVHRKSSA